MKTVICSHGFGVRADGRGMFTEIAAAFPGYHFVMFDYNTFDHEGNATVASLDDQAQALQKVIDESPEDSILLCHSQGSIIAGLIDLDKISHAILLAPPVMMSMERVIEKMMKKEGSIVNLEGISQLPRTDGTITYLPRSYIDSLENRNPIRIYETIAKTKPTTIIRSLNDQVLGLTNVDEVQEANIIDLDADHDFTGSSRRVLIETLEKVLSS